MKPRYRGLCYYCGCPAYSREHAPPRQMFKALKGRCDSITVPSCDEHNTRKSGKDQAIINALLMSLDAWLSYKGSDKSSLDPLVVKAINRAKSLFHYTKEHVESGPLISDPRQELRLPNLAYVRPSADIRAWMRQLTAALAYDAIGAFDSAANWGEATAWSPDFYPREGGQPFDRGELLVQYHANVDLQKVLAKLTWWDGWSAHPRAYPRDIYRFHMCFLAECGAIFKHVFYNSYAWYVEFSASERTMKGLMNKVGENLLVE